MRLAVGGDRAFRREFLKIAVPVALQGLLQSSFSMVDQIMTGQLGEVSIAGIGLAGKFASLYSVLLSAVAAVAGIMIAQYLGKKDTREVGRSFYLNLSMSAGLAAVFFSLCMGIPELLMRLYTPDGATQNAAAEYLRYVAPGFLPTAGSTLLSTLLRCMSHAAIPLYAMLLNAVADTALSYALIFGKLGLPCMGVAGAALATTIAQLLGFFVMLGLFLRLRRKERWALPFSLRMSRAGRKQYGTILVPILICEFCWSLGENVYASIYGHIGTDPCAAMTLTGPMVSLVMGVLGGVSQASGILIGKRLGAGENDAAYRDSKRMLRYELIGVLCLSAALVLLGGHYVRLFRVEPQVRTVGYELLIVFAIVEPVKVLNMILGGGILRSGGQTKYVMAIDLIGTWVFGVPLGFLSAFVFELPITAVYFILSMAECVRLALSTVLFRKRKWMVRMQEH